MMSLSLFFSLLSPSAVPTLHPLFHFLRTWHHLALQDSYPSALYRALSNVSAFRCHHRETPHTRPLVCLIRLISRLGDMRKLIRELIK